jgi:hypothetical protein
MTVAATDYSSIISHLPAGAVVRFDHVSWEEYEQLADLGPRYTVRKL